MVMFWKLGSPSLHPVHSARPPQAAVWSWPQSWQVPSQPSWDQQLISLQGSWWPAAEVINPWGPWGSFPGLGGENGSLSRLCHSWKPQAGSLTGHEHIQAGTVVSRIPRFGFQSPRFQEYSCWPVTMSCFVTQGLGGEPVPARGANSSRK